MERDEDSIPVIVGVGEIADRHTDPAAVGEPAALMATALSMAEQDAGARLLAELDLLRHHQRNILALSRSRADDRDAPRAVAAAGGLSSGRRANSRDRHS